MVSNILGIFFGAHIRTHREFQCLPYTGLFSSVTLLVHIHTFVSIVKEVQMFQKNGPQKKKVAIENSLRLHTRQSPAAAVEAL